MFVSSLWKVGSMREVGEKQNIAKALEVLIPLTSIRTIFKTNKLFLHYFEFLSYISDCKGLDFNAKQNDPSHGL